MAPENRGHHVDPGKSAAVAHRASDWTGSSGLHVAAANLSAARELFLRTRGLRPLRLLCRSGRRGCHLTSDTASITDAGLQPLGYGRLIGLEQFIFPHLTLTHLAQK